MPINPNRLKSIQLEDVEKLDPDREAIERFVEDHLIDPDGLFLCHVNIDTLKPWTKEAFLAEDYRLHFHNPARADDARGGAMGALAYEDSLMATAEYGWSQAVRHRVTGETDALTLANRQLQAILNVLKEGEKFERGYLPKPHGGLKFSSWSHEISHDQYIKCVAFMREFQPFVSDDVKTEIDGWLVAMADYFFNRGFHYPRRESMVVTPETRPHCLSFFIPILTIAGKVTGDAKYADALERFGAIIDQLAAETDHVNCNSSSLMVEGFDLALAEGSDDQRLKTIIGEVWKRHLDFLDDDGRGPEDSHQRPIFKSSRVLRLPSMAPIVDRHFPEMNAFKTAIAMLETIRDPMAMRYINDSVENIPKGQDYRLKSLCETSVSSWLLAYWRLRNNY